MPQNYILLERIELASAAASVVFNNIPQSGYTDLKIVASTRQTNASIGLKMAINGYSAFSGRVLEGSGSSASSYTMTTQLLAGYNNSSAYTANTFASTEIYIPNYTSTTNKSVSADTVTETNGTTAYSALFADLYTTSSPITTITFTADNSGNIDSGSTFSLYGLAAVGTTPVIAPKATGGNLIENDGTYWIHTFYSSGTFTPLTNLTCDYLVVAGGGGAGYNAGGGGGAGGLRSTVGATGGGGSLESPLALTLNTSYTVTVGAGGAGASSPAMPQNGSNSVFGSITSIGGGGGGSYTTFANQGAVGGSGGGGNGNGNIPGGAGTANQGYAGGSGFNALQSAGGGGGAGQVGGNAVNGGGGAGGNGVQTSISGTNTYYAGGGGGAADNRTTGIPNAPGGLGGGGNGSYSSGGTSGTANTGGGAGGSAGGATVYNGGSGIVIIRYPIA